MAKALDGITVVEFAAHAGSAYATMLLAEQGARAIKIEPPDGDPSRGTPHFHALNRSKQSVFLDLDSAADRASARDVLSLADIVVSGLSPARLQRRYLNIAARSDGARGILPLERIEGCPHHIVRVG